MSTLVTKLKSFNKKLSYIYGFSFIFKFFEALSRDGVFTSSKHEADDAKLMRH